MLIKVVVSLRNRMGFRRQVEFYRLLLFLTGKTFLKAQNKMDKITTSECQPDLISLAFFLTFTAVSALCKSNTDTQSLSINI